MKHLAAKELDISLRCLSRPKESYYWALSPLNLYVTHGYLFYAALTFFQDHIIATHSTNMVVYYNFKTNSG